MRSTTWKCIEKNNNIIYWLSNIFKCTWITAFNKANTAHSDVHCWGSGGSQLWHGLMWLIHLTSAAYAVLNQHLFCRFFLFFKIILGGGWGCRGSNSSPPPHLPAPQTHKTPVKKVTLLLTYRGDFPWKVCPPPPPPPPCLHPREPPLYNTSLRNVVFTVFVSI